MRCETAQQQQQQRSVSPSVGHRVRKGKEAPLIARPFLSPELPYRVCQKEKQPKLLSLHLQLWIAANCGRFSYGKKIQFLVEFVNIDCTSMSVQSETYCRYTTDSLCIVKCFFFCFASSTWWLTHLLSFLYSIVCTHPPISRTGWLLERMSKNKEWRAVISCVPSSFSQATCNIPAFWMKKKDGFAFLLYPSSHSHFWKWQPPSSFHLLPFTPPLPFSPCKSRAHHWLGAPSSFFGRKIYGTYFLTVSFSENNNNKKKHLWKGKSPYKTASLPERERKGKICIVFLRHQHPTRHFSPCHPTSFFQDVDKLKLIYSTWVWRGQGNVFLKKTMSGRGAIFFLFLSSKRRICCFLSLSPLSFLSPSSLNLTLAQVSLQTGSVAYWRREKRRR